MKKIHRLTSVLITAVMLISLIPSAVAAEEKIDFENAEYEVIYEYTGEPIPAPTAEDFSVSGSIKYKWYSYDLENPAEEPKAMSSQPIEVGIYILEVTYGSETVQQAVVVMPKLVELTFPDSDNDLDTPEYYAAGVKYPEPQMSGFIGNDTQNNTEFTYQWICADEEENLFYYKPTLPGTYAVAVVVYSEKYYGIGYDYITIGEPADTVLLGGLTVEYDGSVKSAVISAPDGWVEGVDYTVSYTDADGKSVMPREVGNYTVTVTLKNGTEITDTLTVTKRTLYVVDCEIEDKNYDGTADAAVKSVTFGYYDENGEVTEVELDESEYYAYAVFEDENVGVDRSVIGLAVVDSDKYTVNLLSSLFYGDATVKRVEPVLGDTKTTVLNTGDTLGESKITGTVYGVNGEVVDGTFEWADPDIKVANTETDGNSVFCSEEVIFNPDSGNYTELRFTASVEVTRLCVGDPTTCISEKYDDLSMSAWYHNYTDFVIGTELMNGVGNNKFDPSGTTTRAMIVTILWRLEGKQNTQDATEFSDVATGKWYTDAVEWAAAEGIVNGYGNGKFGPEDKITREQLATIFYRYAEYKGAELTSDKSLSVFSDAESISGWAQTALRWAYSNGINTGVSSTQINPKGNASRAEIAAVLYRYEMKFDYKTGTTV